MMRNRVMCLPSSLASTVSLGRGRALIIANLVVKMYTSLPKLGFWLSDPGKCRYNFHHTSIPEQVDGSRLLKTTAKGNQQKFHSFL